MLVLPHCTGLMDHSLDEGPCHHELRVHPRRTQRNGTVRPRSPSLSNSPDAACSPADIRGATHALATATLEFSKTVKASSRANGPPAKRRKQGVGSPRKPKPKPASASGEDADAFHYIGYVPAQGRVWELDGLRAFGPLEVGELPPEASTLRGAALRRTWMDVVRPAIKKRMRNAQKEDSEQLRYSLLAIVEDKYQKASDVLEMRKRERNQLERRLNEVYPDNWRDKVRLRSQH